MALPSVWTSLCQATDLPSALFEHLAPGLATTPENRERLRRICAKAKSLPTRTSTLTVGHQSCCGSTTSFIGVVDELAVYGTALTDAQVAAHFAAAK